MIPISVVKIAGKAGVWFLPPGDDLDLDTEKGRRVYVWRLLMAGMQYVFALSIFALFYLSFGHASAEDVDKIDARLVGVQIDVVDTSICMGQDSGSVDPSLVMYRAELEQQYRELTDEEYRHKPCDLLLSLLR